MQDLAAAYLEHFDLDLDGAGMRVSLSAEAPPDLAGLVDAVCPAPTPEGLAMLFEALTLIAESDDPFFAEPDEKVCPTAVYYAVLDELGKLED